MSCRLPMAIAIVRLLANRLKIWILSSRSSYLEASYRHPIIRTPKQEIALGFAFDYRQNSQLFLEDVGFPTLARGTDIEGVTKISTLRFTQEYSTRSDRNVFAVNSQFNIGLNAFDATINAGNVPDSQFFSMAWSSTIY